MAKLPGTHYALCLLNEGHNASLIPAAHVVQNTPAAATVDANIAGSNAAPPVVRDSDSNTSDSDSDFDSDDPES